jgi:hypothetical protein
MRSAARFNAEWGYLAPAPGFVRTARIVLIAVAVGASAGAAAVFSLVDRPAADESVAARTLARSAGPLNKTAAVLPPAAPARGLAAAESSVISTTQHPASAEALAESPRMTEATAAPTPEATAARGEVAAQVRAIKKHQYYGWWRDPQRQAGRAPLGLTPPASAGARVGRSRDNSWSRDTYWSRDTNWSRDED